MGGFFITIEGADGAGKSTQVKLLADYLSKAGINAIAVREPGGTAIGEMIRNIIIDKNNNEMESVTEVFLYAAARAQVVREVITPALERGTVVICDRFIDSTTAYQSFARGLSLDMINIINEYAAGGLMPDVTFFLDIPPEKCVTRKQNGTPDRLELEGLDFQNKVYDGYRQIAAANKRFITIGAAGAAEQIHSAIINALKLNGGLGL